MKAAQHTGHLFLALVTAMFLLTGAQGADIKKIDQNNGKNTLIFINGQITNGDEKKFLTEALTSDDAIVVLQSPGGFIRPAIEIGKVIRLKGFSTAVVSGECQSACGLIWLAGATRFLSKQGKVGFHAAYRLNQDGTATESGRGNALVGAYLNSLGLPERAIEYISSAPPSATQLLTYNDARRFGIHTTFLDEKFDLPNAGHDPVRPPAMDNPKKEEPPSKARPDQPRVKTGSSVEQDEPRQVPNSKPVTPISRPQQKPGIKGYKLHVCRASDTNIFYSANMAINEKTSFVVEKNVDFVFSTITEPLTISLNVLGRHSTFYIPHSPSDKFLLVYFYHYMFGPRIDGLKFTELSNFFVKGVSASDYFARCAAENTISKKWPPP